MSSVLISFYQFSSVFFRFSHLWSVVISYYQLVSVFISFCHLLSIINKMFFYNQFFFYRIGMCLKFSSPENMNFLLIAQNWSNLSFCKPGSKKKLRTIFFNFQTYGVNQLSRDHQLSDSQFVPFRSLSEPQQWEKMVVLIHPLHLYLSRSNEKIWLFWFTLYTFI